jgi:hypothetical protein
VVNEAQSDLEKVKNKYESAFADWEKVTVLTNSLDLSVSDPVPSSPALSFRDTLTRSLSFPKSLRRQATSSMTPAKVTVSTFMS